MPWTKAFAAALADRYRLERDLGEGGMASVYLARDVRHDRNVAIKVLRPELAEAIGADRFLAEIRTTAGLNHPHILPLFDSGAADGSLFYVMPVVEGESLRQRLDRDGALSVGDAVRIASEVASALDHAHRRGVIHRDVKPENILLQDGKALVADFGIALAPGDGATRLTQTGVTMGTPQYMSPEQMLGDRALDARTDIYAVGVLLYESLTGTTPFRGLTTHAIAAKVLTERPPPPSRHRRDVPQHIDAVVMTAIERDPQRRFDSAAALQTALATPDRINVPDRRLRVVLGVSAAVALLAGGYAVARRPTSTTASSKHSIAALPFRFENFGGDSSRIAALADNIPQQILDGLGGLPDVIVRVMPHDPRFRNVTNPNTVAPELDADIIVMGDVALAGDSIRITIRPYDVRSKRVLTSIPFVSSERNVLALEETISRSVAARLQIAQQAPMLAGDSRRARAVNQAAFNELIRAQWYVESRQCPALDSAIARYTAATRIDSTYAEAWAGLAQAHNLRGAFYCEAPTTAFAPARRAVEVALRLDSSSAAAHTARGFLTLFGDWNPTLSAEEFRRSVQLDSMRSETWLYRSWYYAAVNQLDSARWSMRRAKELDPTSSIIRTRVGSVLWMSDSLFAARDEIEEVLRHEPRFVPAIVQIAPLYAVLKQCDRVREILRTEPALVERGWGDLGFSEARCGGASLARKMIARMETGRARGEFEAAFETAKVYAGLGDTVKVYASLNNALTEHDWQLIHLAWDPDFAAYRASPTFQSILRRVGMPAPGT
jgi:serine/threonine protein kinase